MRRLIGGLVLLLVAGTVVSVVWSIGTKENAGEGVQLVDRLNPLVRNKAIYVYTSDRYGEEKEYGSYAYTQEGISENGKPIKVMYTTPQRLKEQAYLKLDAKGKYVRTYEELAKKDVPIEIREKLTR